MDRRLLRLFALFSLCASLMTGRSALAAPKDAPALKLDRDAIYNDYLATKFGDAEKKLKRALTLCGPTGCSPRVVAQLHRDLGIVYVVAGRAAEGRARFAEALRTDPSITLVKELTTPEIQAAFNAAASGGGAAADVEAAPGPGAPAAPSGAGGDDIVHRPAAEQSILTPVPIFAEMPEGVTPAKVQVRYKPFGATDWKSLDLKKMKGGYGGEIPCLDIGSATGDLKYYIQATDANGDVVATSGSRNAPHKVPIKNDLAGDAPHLPGRPPPAQCANPGDCPPGLPGCAAEKKKRRKGEKEWGATCEEDAECKSGSCRTGACTAEEEQAAAPEAKACVADSDCESGQTCSGGFCAVRSKKNFFSISVQQDLLLLSSANDVCLNQADYSCFFSDNSQYHGTPSNQRDQVSGGLGLATTRLLIGYDRLFGRNITLGAKLGYAINGGPSKDGGKSFVPIHFEARAAYYFGNAPFASTGIHPYITLNGGVAQVDAKVTVQVAGDQTNFPDNGGEGTLAAWKKAGTSFVGAGVGALWALSPGSGLVLEGRFLQLLGASGTGLGLQLGYMFGL